MRIELDAKELSAISIALANESHRLLDQYENSPRRSEEKAKAFQQYMTVSKLSQKVWEAYQRAWKKRRKERSYTEAA
jgi:hypothetical protein